MNESLPPVGGERIWAGKGWRPTWEVGTAEEMRNRRRDRKLRTRMVVNGGNLRRQLESAAKRAWEKAHG